MKFGKLAVASIGLSPFFGLAGLAIFGWREGLLTFLLMLLAGIVFAGLGVRKARRNAGKNIVRGMDEGLTVAAKLGDTFFGPGFSDGLTGSDDNSASRPTGSLFTSGSVKSKAPKPNGDHTSTSSGSATVRGETVDKPSGDDASGSELNDQN